MSHKQTTKNTVRPIAEVIGENIRMFRKISGLTQQQLSEKSGYSERTIQRAEVGQKVEEEVLTCISQVLGTTVDGLRFDYQNPPKEFNDAMDDLIAQETGTGPWRHIPTKRILTPTEAESLIGGNWCGCLFQKDPNLSLEAMDTSVELSQYVQNLDGLDFPPTQAWEMAKDLAALLNTLEIQGGALLSGYLPLTFTSPQGDIPWRMLFLVAVPKEKISHTVAYDLRNLPSVFKESHPSSWTPINAPE